MIRTGLALLIVICLGCGGSGTNFPVARVTGKVTCQGQEVTTGGVVIFSPVPKNGAALAGKKAVGTIRPDGTYTLGTYDESDGAVIGQHTVTITTEGEDAKPIPCKIPQDKIVDVVAGKNTIDIAL